VIRSLLALLARHRRALVFLPWAIALIALLRSGQFRNFLRPELRPVLVVGYLVLLLLIAADLFREEAPPLRGSLLLSPALLLLPLLFLLNARGVQLDGYALQKRLAGTPRLTSPSSPSGPRSTPVPRPPGPAEQAVVSRPVEVTLVDLYDRPEQYEGRYVSLVGMTYVHEEARNDFGSGALVLFRFVVACCAADARPLTVVASRPPGTPAPSDNSWVRAQGRFLRRAGRGGAIPVIEEAVLEPVPAPQSRYLY
jgi:putative membrane protein